MMQKLLKMEKRLDAEKDTYTALKEKHMASVMAQRNYFSLVKQFQVIYVQITSEATVSIQVIYPVFPCRF